MATGRALNLTVLGLTTVLLAGGAWTAQYGLKQLAAERRQVRLADARLVVARQLVPEVEKRERFARLSSQVQAQASQAGFDVARWAQRRIQRSPATLSRREVQDQLLQLGAAGSGRLMAVDGFELAVVSRDAGLFTPPVADDKGLMLAINGTLFFQAAGKP